MLSLLLALGASLGVAAPASATTNDIQGVVSGPGLDLNDVTVYVSQELSTAHGRIFTMFGAQQSGVNTTTGAFSFPVGNGDYMVLVTAGDHWVQWIDGVTVDGVTDLGSVNIVLEPGVPVTGTVRDAATGAGLPGVEVIAFGAGFIDYEEWLNWDIDANDAPVTPSSGDYKIIVPLDDYYELYAENVNDPDYFPQSWNHQVPGGCGCSSYDPVTISPAGAASPAGPYDFDLIDIDDAVFVPIQAFEPDGTTLYEDVDVILEKNVLGTWKLVTHGLTDSSGFVILFGGGDGDYRLRYTVNGTAQRVSLADDNGCGCGTPVPYPLSDSGRVTLLSGGIAGNAFVVNLYFAQPTVPSSGGGSATPPRKPRTSTFTFTLPTPSATPTPTPTPTSTPTPSSSPSSSPSATPSATPDPTPAGDAGFPWWIILIIVIAAGIVILIIVLVVRR